MTQDQFIQKAFDRIREHKGNNIHKKLGSLSCRTSGTDLIFTSYLTDVVWFNRVTKQYKVNPTKYGRTTTRHVKKIVNIIQKETKQMAKPQRKLNNEQA